MTIVNLHAFYREKHTTEFFKCHKCLRSYYKKNNYESHITRCEGKDGVQNESVPNPPICTFQDQDKAVDAPNVMYADIESILKSLDNDIHTNTERTHTLRNWEYDYIKNSRK